MKPRPMWRWKSFWLGVFMACFFAWARWDSTRVETWAQRAVASGVEGIARADGVTIVFRGARNFFAFNGVMRLPSERSGEAMVEDEFELWGTSYVKVEDWMVWALSAVVWVGWMAWRWRRQQFAGFQCEVFREGK